MTDAACLRQPLTDALIVGKTAHDGPGRANHSTASRIPVRWNCVPGHDAASQVTFQCASVEFCQKIQ